MDTSSAKIKCADFGKHIGQVLVWDRFSFETKTYVIITRVRRGAIRFITFGNIDFRFPYIKTKHLPAQVYDEEFSVPADTYSEREYISIHLQVLSAHLGRKINKIRTRKRFVDKLIEKYKNP